MEPGVPTSSRMHVVYRRAVSQTPQAGAHAHTHEYHGSASVHALAEHRPGCEGVCLLCLNVCG